MSLLTEWVLAQPSPPKPAPPQISRQRAKPSLNYQKFKYEWLGLKSKVFKDSQYGKTPVPKVIHYTWMGSSVEKFLAQNVYYVCSTVPVDYTINFWIDAFSMAPDDDLKVALGDDDDLYSRYISSREKHDNPKTIPSTFALLREARGRYTEHLKKQINSREMPALPSLFWAFCKDAHSNMKLNFLDIDCYPRWIDAGHESLELANLIFYELYKRGSNYGSSGDLARCQLLIEQGGIYVDHDDPLDVSKIPEPVVGLTCGIESGEGELTCSFIMAPVEHPLIIKWRETMLGHYAQLCEDSFEFKGDPNKDNYGCLCNVLRENVKPDLTWYDLSKTDRTIPIFRGLSPFQYATIFITGPAAFRQQIPFNKKSNVEDITYWKMGKGNAW